MFTFLGHVQIAQVPDRNEPDTVGEIDYKYVFSLLEKHNYNDYIGLEYKPRAGSVEGLDWINRFGYNLWLNYYRNKTYIRFLFNNL